jgi:hypothetical protein
MTSSYFCLSHYCGKLERPFTTTKVNLDDRERNIQVAATPKTFREAIGIARKLGARYLWIDSLCIVQDDEADWEVEAA